MKPSIGEVVVVKRGRVVAYVAGGLALAAAAGTLLFGGPAAPVLDAVGVSPLLVERTDLSRALEVVPADTERLSYTDWELVREVLGSNLAADSPPAAIEAMIAKAYDTDLSASSSIEGSAVALQTYFGFSPATIQWEAYSQTETGAAMVVKVPDGFDFRNVRDRMTESGFTPPDKADGVWNGGIDLVAALDGTLTPKLQYVALIEDDGLILSSETAEYVEQAVAVVRGKTKSLAESAGTRELLDGVSEPATAQIWVDDFACRDLSMSAASAEDQAAAEALVRQAGKISPLAGLMMSMDADRTFTVAELFESADQAEANLEARARLIVGEAPGVGGSFSDNLELVSSTTDGPVVRLVAEPRTGTGFVLGALNQGPILFAAC